MLLHCIELEYPIDEVLYYESGMDFPCIEANAKKMEAFVRSKGIKFTTVRSKESFLYYMLHKERTVHDENGDEQKIYGYGFCGGPLRYGTGLKIAALREAYKKYEGHAIVEYVGIANNEKSRMKRRRDGERVQIYPLIEWGYSEADCLQYCHEHGWFWRADPADETSVDLYDEGRLKRISCKFCVNKNLDELRYMYHEMPQIWAELRSLQEQIGEDRPFKKGITVREYEERFRKEDNAPKQLSLF